MDDWPQLTIGEVARRAGLATSSIRYYESIGLLPEPDRLHGQRRYRTDVLGRLAFIDTAQTAGFKLDEIKTLLAGVDDADGMASKMRALSTQKLGEIEAVLVRAQAMKGWLEAAKQCACQTPAECTLFPAPGQQSTDTDAPLTIVHINAGHCRRQPS
jgi:MerR family transcriptional regulator, redox-sensitive transcriptional activator SoxR